MKEAGAVTALVSEAHRFLSPILDEALAEVVALAAKSPGIHRKMTAEGDVIAFRLVYNICVAVNVDGYNIFRGEIYQSLPPSLRRPALERIENLEKE